MKRRKRGILIGAVLTVVIALCFLPVVLTGGLLTTIAGFLNPNALKTQNEDVHWKALQAVSARYQPENDIDVYLIKVIDLFSHEKITENQGQIEQFIQTWFLVKREREVTVSKEGEAEKTRTETYYEYKSFYELVSTVREPPFSFGDGAISSIVNLSMMGVTLGDGANTGDTTAGGSVSGDATKPPAGMDGTLSGRYPAPVKGGVITCGYGGRVNPITGKAEVHPALDIQDAWHSPITSIAAGTVELISTKVSPYGNYVVIKHELPEGTFWSKYGHLSRIDVSVGQRVGQEEAIGIEGGNPTDPNPGWSTGHHVHLEIWTEEGHVNPADYIY